MREMIPKGTMKYECEKEGTIELVDHKVEIKGWRFGVYNRPRDKRRGLWPYICVDKMPLESRKGVYPVYVVHTR